MDIDQFAFSAKSEFLFHPVDDIAAMFIYCPKTNGGPEITSPHAIPIDGLFRCKFNPIQHTIDDMHFAHQENQPAQTAGNLGLVIAKRDHFVPFTGLADPKTLRVIQAVFLSHVVVLTHRDFQGALVFLRGCQGLVLEFEIQIAAIICVGIEDHAEPFVPGHALFVNRLVIH